jgi:tetratricopeptide (TPR) repeat protein
MPDTASSTDEFASLHARAQELLRLGQLDRAQELCVRILKHEPAHADAHFLLGMIAAQKRRFDKALAFVERAIALDGGRAEYHAHRGRCLAMRRQTDQALAAVERAMELKPNDALSWDTIGVVLSHAGDHNRAADSFGRSARLRPNNPGYQFNLASSLKFIGDLEGAEQAYEAAIAADPAFYRAHWALANLRRQTAQRNHVGRLERLLPEAETDVDGQLYLRYSLAKEYEDLGQYDRAFDCWQAANQRKRASLDYDIADDAAIFEALQRKFRGLGQSPATGCGTEEPIFILGMPRTGTTLVERILSSHSQVHSAGELQNLGLLIKRGAATPSRRILDEETIRRGLELDPAALGQAYLDSTRPGTGHTAHFIDKTPLNFLLIGFIYRALPNARIICLRRHPLDTVLSNFRQLFALQFSYYNYAYDIEDTARYFLLFNALMQFWDEELPGRILRVDYESLVADQAGESRRIIEHCGLAWEEACLNFEQNAAPVATASAAQVREPVYTRAVARWRRYADQLAPARALLEAAGVEIE